jgi:hypothetical protein
MYNISKVIDKIVRIDIVTDSKILVVRDNALECYVDDTIIWSYTFRSNHIPITKYFMNDKDCLVAFDTILYRFHYDKFLFEKFLELGFYPTCQHFKKLIGHNFGKIYAYNLQTNKNDLEINDYDGGYLLILNNIIQLNFPKRNFLTCHPLSTGEEKWRLNFDALLGIAETRLYGDILEDKERLFFFLSEVQAGVGATFCISLETGEVLQKIESFGGWLQLVDGQLYVLGRKELKILNPDTFEKTVVDFSAILAPHDWQFTWNKYVIKDHYLYFINENVGGGGTATVGILDIRTQDLVWYTDIEIEAGKYWIAEIRVQDNRLYVLTQGGTLYVYEYEGV